MLDPKNDNLGKRYTENLTLGEYFDGQDAVIFKTSLTLQFTALWAYVFRSPVADFPPEQTRST